MSSRLRTTLRFSARIGGTGLLLASLLALAAPSMSRAAEDATPRHGGILTFAVEAEPSNYDCDANVSFAFMHPVAPHYSTLLKFDAPNYPEIKGDLAQSWTVSADKLTYTFKLKPGVLFHDGSKLTSADVKASYQRIIDPAPGVASPRRAMYGAIASIDTPDDRTVVFHMNWPEAAMLANFASPWNCIFSAAKLAADPLYPKAHVMGTGPFVFVEHVKGSHWTGKRWDKYFERGKPYLDGYVAEFIKGKAVVAALEKGDIDAQFRSFTPTERDELVKVMGDKVAISESPWLINLLLTFNARHHPFDDERVRRALSIAIDRWTMADKLAGTTYLKFVGGLLRPGFAMATPESELATLPGFSRDPEAARAEAKRLLAAAGVKDLSFTLVNRDVPLPYGPAAQYVIDAWRAVGVNATEKKLNTKDWEAALDKGAFDVAFDFGGDYFDDPTQQLARYISPDLSPSNHTGGTDRLLDALFIGQAITLDQRKRSRILRDFERRELTDAYSVPLLWWNRIVAASSRMYGWAITPSHYLNQDLADVWLDPKSKTACAVAGQC